MTDLWGRWAATAVDTVAPLRTPLTLFGLWRYGPERASFDVVSGLCQGHGRSGRDPAMDCDHRLPDDLGERGWRLLAPLFLCGLGFVVRNRSTTFLKVGSTFGPAPLVGDVMFEEYLNHMLRWNYHLPDLTDQNFSEIGRVIVQWSFLEEKVADAFSILLRLDTRQGLAVTLPIRNFRSRFAMLVGVIEQSGVKSDIQPLAKEILRLYAIRNALAHRPWWASGDNNLHSFNLNPNTLPFHPAEQWSVSALQQASQDIKRAIDQLQNFTENCLPLLDSLRDRFQPPTPEGTGGSHSNGG